MNLSIKKKHERQFSTAMDKIPATGTHGSQKLPQGKSPQGKSPQVDFLNQSIQDKIKYIKAKATLKALSALRKSQRPPSPVF